MRNNSPRVFLIAHENVLDKMGFVASAVRQTLLDPQWIIA
jgi:hypothetical protein